MAVSAVTLTVIAVTVFQVYAFSLTTTGAASYIKSKNNSLEVANAHVGAHNNHELTNEASTSPTIPTLSDPSIMPGQQSNEGVTLKTSRVSQNVITSTSKPKFITHSTNPVTETTVENFTPRFSKSNRSVLRSTFVDSHKTTPEPKVKLFTSSSLGHASYNTELPLSFSRASNNLVLKQGRPPVKDDLKSFNKASSLTTSTTVPGRYNATLPTTPNNNSSTPALPTETPHPSKLFSLARKNIATSYLTPRNTSDATSEKSTPSSAYKNEAKEYNTANELQFKNILSKAGDDQVRLLKKEGNEHKNYEDQKEQKTSSIEQKTMEGGREGSDVEEVEVASGDDSTEKLEDQKGKVSGMNSSVDYNIISTTLDKRTAQEKTLIANDETEKKIQSDSFVEISGSDSQVDIPNVITLKENEVNNILHDNNMSDTNENMNTLSVSTTSNTETFLTNGIENIPKAKINEGTLDSPKAGNDLEEMQRDSPHPASYTPSQSAPQSAPQGALQGVAQGAHQGAPHDTLKMTATLRLAANSSALIGYSDDPFHVSDTLNGKSRKVEVLRENVMNSYNPLGPQLSMANILNVPPSNYNGTGSIHSVGQIIDQVSTADTYANIISSSNVQLDDPTAGFHLHAPQRQDDNASSSTSAEKLPMVVTQTTVQSSTNNHLNRANRSELVHHDGMPYISKNFLIMPLFTYNTDHQSQRYSSVSSTVSPTSLYPPINDVSQPEEFETTTQISLLNQRVPIYQEIAGTMRIDSSIDDTIDTDEPPKSETEEDDDEKYLPVANASVVNLVDPTVPIRSSDNTDGRIEQHQLPQAEQDNVSVSNGSELDEAEIERTSSDMRLQEKHYKFVLRQKEELMSTLIDPSADPCEDFYQYSCGGWNKRFALRPDQAVDNTFERLRDDLDSVLVSLLEEPSTPHEPTYTTMAKKLFQGCMNLDAIEEAGTQPLLDLLQQLGGWPVLEGEDWDQSTFDVSLQMGLLRTLNNEVLLAEVVADDVTNSSRRIVQFDQPKLGLPGRNYYLSSSDVKYREAYLGLMLDTCTLLGADHLLALRDMSEVLFFEIQLAKLLVPPEERRNLSAIHRRYTREELKESYPAINWDTYLDTIAPNHTDYTQEVRVFCTDYLHKLTKLLNTTEPRIVSNYLLWRLVKNRLGNLGSAALEIKEKYIKVLFGRSTQPNRWRSCISYVNGNLGGIVGAMFVSRYFPEESRRDTEDMIGLIREAFGETVGEAEWMLPETRQVALDKVQAIVWNVGYPDDLFNSTYMAELFGELEFSPSSHFSNVLTMLRHHSHRSHEQLGKPVNRTAWAASPATVNAYYSRTKNMIMFPAGILQPPFYHPAYPRALNYGGIGVVIGHEISHGFDDGGRQFDRRGNLKQWWSKKDVMAFYARATCMLEQYGDFKVAELDMPVNAITTLGENIADNAGLDIAYKAYQRWLTTNTDTGVLPHLNLTLSQLFFLNFGQIWCEVNTPEAALTALRTGRHAPNRFRVIGTLSNSAAFSEAYSCSPGSPMNPADKCAVW